MTSAQCDELIDAVNNPIAPAAPLEVWLAVMVVAVMLAVAAWSLRYSWRAVKYRRE